MQENNFSLLGVMGRISSGESTYQTTNVVDRTTYNAYAS